MQTGKLKINLFGEALTVKRFILSENLLIRFHEIATKMKQPVGEVLSDPYFYHLLKNETIKSADDLESETVNGLLNTPKNQIEIWHKNKKVQKLKIDDLRDELLLFPLYNTSVKIQKPKYEAGFYLEQKEIGLIASYEIVSGFFNIDNLEFQLLNLKDSMLLEKITYEGQELLSKKKDTLITFQNSYEVL